MTVVAAINCTQLGEQPPPWPKSQWGTDHFTTDGRIAASVEHLGHRAALVIDGSRVLLGGAKLIDTVPSSNVALSMHEHAAAGAEIQ